MNKIPMQVYLDPEIVAFYKEYARIQGKSFAQLIREAIADKKEKIAFTIKKTQKKPPLLLAFKKAKKQLKDIEYHKKNSSDNKLLYIHDR